MVKTKTDTNGQSAAVEVRPEQDVAINVLLTGATDQAAADAAGVTRQTVNTWVNGDSVFVAELNRRRSLLWASHQDRLRGLIGGALQVLQDDLGSTDPGVKRDAARLILKSFGLTGADLAPTGSTDPERVQLEWSKEMVSPLEWAITY